MCCLCAHQVSLLDTIETICQRIFEVFDVDLQHEFCSAGGIILCYIPRDAVADVKAYTGPFARYQDGVEHNQPVYLLDKSRTLESYFKGKKSSELQEHVSKSMFLVLHVTQQLQSNPQGILHQRFSEKQLGYDEVDPEDDSDDKDELVMNRMEAIESSLKMLASSLDSRPPTSFRQSSPGLSSRKLQPLRFEEPKKTEEPKKLKVYRKRLHSTSSARPAQSPWYCGALSRLGLCALDRSIVGHPIAAT